LVSNDLYALIKEIILHETIFLRHYICEIFSVTDPLQKGRIQVLLRDIGFETGDVGIWAWPRQGNAMSLPSVGDWAEVYFINGDSGRPVYLFPASEIGGNTPGKFDGLPSTHVLFQDPVDTVNYITFKSGLGLYDMFGKLKINTLVGTIDMLKATSRFVLGDQLDTWINSTLMTWLVNHTHTFTGAGVVGAPPPTPPLVAPTGYLSDDIKGS
jgi:hypothetical protein